MIRIEKTQINISAMIIISSTLRDIQSDHIIEIKEGGKSIILRKKQEHEKKDMSIDLTFLEKISKALLFGSPAPVVLDKEVEQYFKNCSFACYFYQTEKDEFKPLDPFYLFHTIHFVPPGKEMFVQEFCQRLLGLFRIAPDTSNHLFSPSTSEKVIDLPEPKAFNEIFASVSFTSKDGWNRMVLSSGKLEMHKAVDSLFSVKDLLCASGFDVKAIPELHVFSIQIDEQVIYTFQNDSLKITVKFRYTEFIVEVSVNAN